jgi:hypothetical protein
MRKGKVRKVPATVIAQISRKSEAPKKQEKKKEKARSITKNGLVGFVLLAVVVVAFVKLAAVKKGLDATSFGVAPPTEQSQTPSTMTFHKTTKKNGTAVVVGRQGPAVERAKTYGLAQKMKGIPKHQWHALETSMCLEQGQPAFLNKTRNDNEQRRQMPQAILIGVQKGGTTALYSYLDQHPDIANTEKELWFLDAQLDNIVLKQRQGGGIPRLEARQAYKMLLRKSMKDPLRDGDKMLLDLTPNYIFENNRLPARIACIVPWVKLFCLLRNPMDRARSQYDMKVRFIGQSNRNLYGKPVPTFDEYVQNDIAALRETGVLQDWSVVDFDDFFNSPECWQAWRTYLNSGLNAPVGMGLYALQLKPFLEQLPNNEFLAITSEDLQSRTEETYNRVLDFLALKRHHLKSYPQANRARQKHKMSNETQQVLRQVFEPFNRKLGELLGKEWEGIWTS